MNSYKQTSVRHELRRLAPIIWGETLTTLASNAALILIPVVYKLAIDQAFPRKDVQLWLWLVLAFLGLILLYLAFTFVAQRLLWKRSVQFEKNLKDRLFERLMWMPPKQFRKHKLPEQINLLSEQITTLEQDYLTPKISFIQSILTLGIYAIVVILSTHWLIFLSLLIGSLLTLLSPKLLKKRLATRTKGYIDERKRYMHLVEDLLHSFDMLDSKSVLAFATRHEAASRSVQAKRLHMGRAKLLSLLVSGACLFLIDFLVFLSSGELILLHNLSLGVLVASFSYIQSFIDPLRELVYCVNTINSTEELRKEVDAILQIEDRWQQREHDPKPWSKLSLQRVSVVFPQKALTYDFQLEAGKKYLLQGRSGSGKSTLFRVLQGQVDYEGSICIDGQRRHFREAEYFYLPQNQRVFAEDYASNVSLFGAYPYEASLVPEDQAYRAMRQVSDATQLSGGEQQILKFERCLNTGKSLLLLDEPFANLDAHKSAELLAVLEAYEGTVVLISHEQREYSSEWTILEIEDLLCQG